MLDSLLGSGDNMVMRTIVGLLLVLIIIAIISWILRRVMGTQVNNRSRGRQPRISIADSQAIDNRHRLVLVRRDNVEHLLLIGGSNNLVVEEGINKQAHPRAGKQADPIPAPPPVLPISPIEEPAPAPAKAQAPANPAPVASPTPAPAKPVSAEPRTPQRQTPSRPVPPKPAPNLAPVTKPAAPLADSKPAPAPTPVPQKAAPEQPKPATPRVSSEPVVKEPAVKKADPLSKDDFARAIEGKLREAIARPSPESSKATPSPAPRIDTPSVTRAPAPEIKATPDAKPFAASTSAKPEKPEPSTANESNAPDAPKPAPRVTIEKTAASASPTPDNIPAKPHAPTSSEGKSGSIDDLAREKAELEDEMAKLLNELSATKD